MDLLINCIEEDLLTRGGSLSNEGHLNRKTGLVIGKCYSKNNLKISYLI